jgi:uroporphyrinogen decarboxylase
VLGLDWRTSITDARRRMGADLVVQGNLDPALVLAGADVALAATDAVLDDNCAADGNAHPGHVFNLGHGVPPNADPGVLQAVVDRVKERTTR